MQQKEDKSDQNIPQSNCQNTMGTSHMGTSFLLREVTQWFGRWAVLPAGTGALAPDVCQLGLGHRWLQCSLPLNVEGMTEEQLQITPGGHIEVLSPP